MVGDLEAQYFCWTCDGRYERQKARPYRGDILLGSFGIGLIERKVITMVDVRQVIHQGWKAECIGPSPIC